MAFSNRMPAAVGPAPSAVESPRSQGHWFGDAERPLLGWLTQPAGARAETGVLILPAVGYQYWTAHRTLRVLAERLAETGHLALRLDYDGIGDSAGEQSDLARVAAWRASVCRAAQELRELGCSRLVVVGLRLGASLALLEGGSLAADAIVAVSPVVSGRRYARELRMLSTPVPDEHAPRGETGAVAVAGTLFSSQTLAELAEIDLLAIDSAPAARALILGSRDEGKLTDRLAQLGVEVEHAPAPGLETALEVPTEEATVPMAVLERIERWVGEPPVAVGPPVAPRTQTRLRWRSAALEERVLQLGREPLAAILTRSVPDPLSAASDPAHEPGSTGMTAVFLNTGSEAHVGPGRAWVEYARGLAALGHQALRVDFRGWGESPDDGHAPGRPYDEHCEQDTVSIIRALREQGHRHIVLIGLCASAWVALRTVRHEPVDGVIALNPQLYWRPGDPVEATMAETRLRRTAEREREERGGRYGLWSALDMLGHRPWAARWLDELDGSGVPVTMVYAAGDDGLEYMHNRVRRRLASATSAGAITIAEVPDIDHSMHRLWLRERILAVLHERLQALAD